MSQQPLQNVGIGKTFNILLSTLATLIFLIPRLAASLNKALDMVDDVLDSGKSITTTMKESAEDFRNTSKLEADANYQARLDEINATRKQHGLPELNISSTRTLSPAAKKALEELGISGT